MVDLFDDLGFAKLDSSRNHRTGINETVYCPGKTDLQLVEILRSFEKQGHSALGTRCTPIQAKVVKESGLAVHYDETSKIITLSGGKRVKLAGKIAVCTGGTADVPVAEEAAQVAEFLGAEIERYYDVGVAGIHRLFAKLEEIRRTQVIIAVAGMEGALPGVVAGLVEAPVIAVPTSVGYGTSFNGVTPLLTMLNSCAEGVSVVNIDNGFGAAVLACKILRMIGKIHD